MLSHVQHHFHLAFVQALCPGGPASHLCHEAFARAWQRHPKLAAHFVEPGSGQTMFRYRLRHTADARAQPLDVAAAKISEDTYNDGMTQ